MKYVVTTRQVGAELIAAVRVRTPIAGIASAWKPALDQVWAFLGEHPELRAGGHNLFLYHHPARREDPMDIDFGVQVPRRFASEGNVACVATPEGEVATTTHIGPYDQLRGAHEAVHAWCAANNRAIGAMSWETYGDWGADPAKLETTVSYLLR